MHRTRASPFSCECRLHSDGSGWADPRDPDSTLHSPLPYEDPSDPIDETNVEHTRDPVHSRKTLEDFDESRHFGPPSHRSVLRDS